MPFAAAVSEHPLATHATGEVVGDILEKLPEAPDLAVLFVTGPHVGVLEDIAATVARLLRPGCLVGATAVSVLGGREEAEGTPGVSLWAGTTGAVAAHHVEVVDGHDGPRLIGVDGADLEAAEPPSSSPTPPASRSTPSSTCWPPAIPTSLSQAAWPPPGSSPGPTAWCSTAPSTTAGRCSCFSVATCPSRSS